MSNPGTAARGRTPTSKDVARTAGVSQATVSLVLGGKWHGRVSERTADAVRRAARALGYRPNLAARHLRLGRTRTALLVVPALTNDFFGRVYTGASEVAAEHGFGLLLYPSPEGVGPARDPFESARTALDGVIASSMAARAVEAIRGARTGGRGAGGGPLRPAGGTPPSGGGSPRTAGGPSPAGPGGAGPAAAGPAGTGGPGPAAGEAPAVRTPPGDGPAEAVRSGGGTARDRAAGCGAPSSTLPLVMLDSDPVPDDASGTATTVNHDIADGMRQIMAHLTGLGHRRITHVAASVRSWTFQVRARAFEEAMAALPGGHGRTETAELTVPGGRLASERALVHPGHRPTALVCDDDILAAGACKAVRRLGLSVPDDVSVTGFGDLTLATALDPELTTVRLPAHDLGARGMSALLALLDGAPVGQPDLPVHLVPRGSTARPR